MKAYVVIIIFINLFYQILYQFGAEFFTLFLSSSVYWYILLTFDNNPVLTISLLPHRLCMSLSSATTTPVKH